MGAGRPQHGGAPLGQFAQAQRALLREQRRTETKRQANSMSQMLHKAMARTSRSFSSDQARADPLGLFQRFARALRKRASDTTSAGDTDHDYMTE